MALTAVSVSEWREDEEKQTDTLTSPTHLLSGCPGFCLDGTSRPSVDKLS